MTDLGDKIDPETRTKIESAATALEEAIKSNIGIKEKKEALESIWNEASTKMYEAAKAAGPQGWRGALRMGKGWEEPD